MTTEQARKYGVSLYRRSNGRWSALGFSGDYRTRKQLLSELQKYVDGKRDR